MLKPGPLSLEKPKQWIAALGQAVRQHPLWVVLVGLVSLGGGCFVCSYFGWTLLAGGLFWGVTRNPGLLAVTLVLGGVMWGIHALNWL